MTIANKTSANGRRRALICGVTGQDGAYLTRFLLDRGYSVVVGKSQGYGGWFSITGQARATLPDFQVAVCAGRNRLLYPWYLALALAGQLERSSDYQFFRTTRLRVSSSEPVRFQLDGDSAGFLPGEFSVDGATVQILCPEDGNVR